MENSSNGSLDTYGLSFAGELALSPGMKVHYRVAYATQDSDGSAADYDADYMMAEASINTHNINLKLNYEVLGSDNGGYGFATPLATVHKFNGWADTFINTPAQGLADIALSASGKLRGTKWLIVYHDYESDDSAPGISDFGNELNLQLTRPIDDHLVIGIKYADYNAGDVGTGKVDTQKFWFWVQLKF